MAGEMQVTSAQASVKPATETQLTEQAQQTQQQPVVKKPEGPSPAELSEQSAEAIHETVAAINDFMSQFKRTLNFSVDIAAGQTIIKVIDTSNDELVRQIPSEDFIEISKHIEQMNNLLFSEKA
ncbi:flagellar protein FlaG [Amphritea sp. HPY]|uniref:flagellar protein FlaG n=1 Tax=Amphritea sp. HPY TaxID=3421652 RepID=UPI003D7D06DE